MDFAMNAQFQQHALDCGLDMTGSAAVSVEDANGLVLSHKVLDPVYFTLLLHPGTCMTNPLIYWLKSFRVDYVCVVSS